MPLLLRLWEDEAPEERGDRTFGGTSPSGAGGWGGRG